MTEVISTIGSIINNHTYTVDDEMLKYFDDEFAKGTYSSRENIEGLALEWSLRKVGILTTLPKVKGEEYQWRHDWAFSHNILIDLKRRPAHSQNTCISHWQKAVSSYNIGQLTHYVIYTTNIERNLKLNDVLTFEFEDMMTVKEAYKLSFAPCEEFRLIPKRDLQYEAIGV